MLLSRADRLSMSRFSFFLCHLRIDLSGFMLLCPNMELTVSMGTPLERNMVVAMLLTAQVPSDVLRYPTPFCD